MQRPGAERDPILGWLLLLLSVCGGLADLTAAETVLHLKSGDRITGVILSENAAVVIVSNSWARGLSVPTSEITRRDVLIPQLAPGPATGKSDIAAATSERPLFLLPTNWSGNLQLGIDYRSGTADRILYFARLRLAYERRYMSNPGKSFRNGLDYSIEYSETDTDDPAEDSTITSDRMNVINKTAADLTVDWYAYNLAGAGYDHVKRIDFQYEAGPGIGYHLFARTNFTMNLEAGMNYQAQYFDDDTEIKDVYFRLAEELSWKINGRMTLVERFEFFPRITISDFRLRFETTLSYELWKNLSLNWTVLDLYDTQPAAGVDRNELQIRSSLGVKF